MLPTVFQTQAKQRAVLLTGCGGDTYQLIRSLVFPAKPTERTFSEIVELVHDHLLPAPSSIVQRFKFFCRSQQDSESVSQFVAELRKLSEFCEFGDTLDVMLRDRLVCGVRNQKLQQRLLRSLTSPSQRLLELHRRQNYRNKMLKTYNGRRQWRYMC